MTSPVPHYASPIDPALIPDRLPATKGARLTTVVLKPAQLQLAHLLEARTAEGLPAFFDPVVELPRRVGKTTTIFATLIGRCVMQPGYKATYCAQTGQKSRERFYDVKAMLEQGSVGQSGWRDRASRGEERFEFANGSRLRFLPPKAENFRGDADDTIVFDEAQEIDPLDGDDLVGAVLPLFDTRPGAQIIIAGTAGKYRSGLFWDALEQGRRGERPILEYSAQDDPDYMETLFSKDQANLSDEAIAVLLTAHPGIGSLTTLDKIVRNWRTMGTEQFLREYLGVWPAAQATIGLDKATWDSRAGGFVDRPRQVALAFDVAPDRSVGSIVAAWRDEAGKVRVEVLEQRGGTEWLVGRLDELARTYRATVYYDAQGGALDVAAALSALGRSTEGLTTAKYAAACAAFVARVIDDRMRHHDQPDLNAAVEAAARRRIGDGLWGWGRRASSAPITSLVAATVASYAIEGMPVRQGRHIISAARAGGH